MERFDTGEVILKGRPRRISAGRPVSDCMIFSDFLQLGSF